MIITITNQIISFYDLTVQVYVDENGKKTLVLRLLEIRKTKSTIPPTIALASRLTSGRP